MARPFARSFYKGAAWQRTQRAYMEMPVRTPAGVVPPRMCERCFALGQLTPAKVVHHKVHITPGNVNDPSVTLDPANLMRVCQDCHAVLHSGGGAGLPVVGFDAAGHPVGRVER